MFKKKKQSELLTEEAMPETAEISFEGENIKVKPPKKPTSSKRTIGIVLMILSIVSIVVVGPLLQSFQEKNYVTIYVAKQDIEKGFEITEQMVEEVSTPQSNALAALTFASNPVGKIAQTDIEASDIITKSTVGDTMPFDQDYLYEIPADKQVISITLGNLASGLSGYIQAGDVVRVYTYDGTEDANQPLALEYVRVLDVTYSASGDNQPIATVLLLVDNAQASILVEKENSSSVHLTLINRFDKEKSEKLLAQQDETNKTLNEVVNSRKEVEKRVYERELTKELAKIESESGTQN